MSQTQPSTTCILGGLVAAFCLTLITPSFTAAETSRLELTDDSVIVGEVLGMSGGLYRVRSPTLGTLNIESSRIRAIRNGDRSPDTPALSANQSATYGPEIDALQRQMVGDAGLMQMIMGLQNDPALQRAVADPELMGLISAGDIDAIRDNPSVRGLMSHPGIRAIIEQLQLR
ncbi:MAG: hypothetical protein WBG92_18285 [Thiohalocapsa sp.]